MNARHYRRTVDDCLSISVFWLNRAGFLNSRGTSTQICWKDCAGEIAAEVVLEVQLDGVRYSSEDHISLKYAITDRYTQEKESIANLVDLTSTPCNFGGKRYWFLCPLDVGGRPCNRRVATLHLPIGQKHFGCRHCHNLTYRSSQEAHWIERMAAQMVGQMPGVPSRCIAEYLKFMFGTRRRRFS